MDTCGIGRLPFRWTLQGCVGSRQRYKLVKPGIQLRAPPVHLYVEPDETTDDGRQSRQDNRELCYIHLRRVVERRQQRIVYLLQY